MSEDRKGMQLEGLEVLSTGLNLAELDLHGGEGFWDEVQRFVRESNLDSLVDQTMGGRPAPRVWALIESPGAGPAAAAAGLGIARLLADRGQAVVLVDADEQEPRISHWLGRNEEEGWIDMVRFGASLHSASDALPSDNRRGSVMGVGSFAPTGVTPDEVKDLVGRLRRHADDLVLVLPAKLRSLPWFEAAPIKLLCWDLLVRRTIDTERIIIELERMGAKPDAVLGFGVEEFTAINDSIRESETTASAPVVEEPVDEEPVVAAETPVEDIPDIVEEPSAPVEETAEEPPEVAEETVEDEPVVMAEPSDPEPLAEPEEAKPKKRRTSGIFVFTAVALVACLGLLGLFLSGQLDFGRDQHDSPALAQLQPTPVIPASSEAETPPETTEPVNDQMGDSGDDGVADDVTAGDQAAGEQIPVEVQEPEALPTPVQPEPEVIPETMPEAEDEGDADPVPVFDQESFQKPVGDEGWALWLYSFPDEPGAQSEIRRLDHRGVLAAYHAVEVENKGTWYRVYAGSFPNRTAANAAVDGLKAHIKHDWVVPARYEN